MKQTYTISELAKEFEVTARTIRHYEDLNLVSPSRNGTQRVFSNRDHVRLGLILRGRRIGFSLGEISEIINMYDRPEGKKKQTSFLLNKVEERRQMLLNRQEDIKKMLSELDGIESRIKK